MRKPLLIPLLLLGTCTLYVVGDGCRQGLKHAQRRQDEDRRIPLSPEESDPSILEPKGPPDIAVAVAPYLDGRTKLPKAAKESHSKHYLFSAVGISFTLFVENNNPASRELTFTVDKLEPQRMGRVRRVCRQKTVMTSTIFKIESGPLQGWVMKINDHGTSADVFVVNNEWLRTMDPERHMPDWQRCAKL